MSYKVKKGKQTVTVRDKNQLAAFLNNGWTQVGTAAKSTDKTAAQESAK